MLFMVQALTAAFALAAGILWFRSATVVVPVFGAILSGPREEDLEPAKRQSRLNAYAAYCASVAAALQAIELLFTP